ncbi:MAG: hypothetical protein M1820_003599, partial [Bogoriella megaspora]
MTLTNDKNSGVSGAAGFVGSTLGNTVGSVTRTVGNVTGTATRGVGDVVTSATGQYGKPVGDAVGSIGTGVEDAANRVGKGAEDIGHGKNPGRGIYDVVNEAHFYASDRPRLQYPCFHPGGKALHPLLTPQPHAKIIPRPDVGSTKTRDVPTSPSSSFLTPHLVLVSPRGQLPPARVLGFGLQASLLMHHDGVPKAPTGAPTKGAESAQPQYFIDTSPRRQSRLKNILTMMLATVLTVFAFLWTTATASPGSSGYAPPTYGGNKTCNVQPAPDGGDSAPAILDAFKECGQGGKVVFANETYHVNSVMETLGLENVEVDIQGTLLWSTDIDYWLNNSLPMGYQNQSTAWRFGGRNIHLYGNGYGTFDGNGQVWYTFINGTSNYDRRPHQITFTNISDSVIENVRFVQSQMWTMTVIYASNVLLQDIFVSSTSNDSTSTVNTDGADTIYANNITFRRWSVRNGDDSISQKANSTNILMEDCDFYDGSGIALGSIGQYADRYETIQNVTARNIRFTNTVNAGYIKTWTGVQKGYPPNGGGGGHGFLTNVSFSDFNVTEIGIPFAITQCTSYNGQRGDCDTSEFNLSNTTFSNVQGTTRASANATVAQLQCSGASPCTGIEVKDVNVTQSIRESGGTADTTSNRVTSVTRGVDVRQPAGGRNGDDGRAVEIIAGYAGVHGEGGEVGGREAAQVGTGFEGDGGAVAGAGGAEGGGLLGVAEDGEVGGVGEAGDCA